MWIDIFPASDVPAPPPVDISLKPPVTYELRVIIWNTAEVMLLEDDFFTGTKKSDILVKGHMMGLDETQSTDVHYRSLTGEGNFNWRFIFRFDYLANENKIVIAKTNFMGARATDQKFPCKLVLQVWENDTFSQNDFLGTLALELTSMPRGSKDPRDCNLTMMGRDAPKMNLLKQRRTKGWWPFHGFKGDSSTSIVTGKLEAEFEIVDADEAERNPVGRGRKDPHPLPKPKRPDTSFSWFLNPWHAFKHVVFKLHRWKIIKWMIYIFLFISIILTIYKAPGFILKKLLKV